MQTKPDHTAESQITASQTGPLPWDIHCHTEYAYCTRDTTAAQNILVCKDAGLAGLGLVEHAFHLYFPVDMAWSFRWQNEHDAVEKAFNGETPTRMAKYRRFIREIRRDPFVRIGLELDLLNDGRLLLAPQDSDGWDYLIGAIHACDGLTRPDSQSHAEKVFMRDLERLLAHPIQVLAHPFRFFNRGDLTKPTHLYKAVADLLAATGVAAEINHHINQPDPAFFRLCLERNVKIALGTDAHEPFEVGNLDKNLEFLNRIGVQPEDYGDLLYNP